MILNKRKHLKNSEIFKLDGYFRAANYLSVGQLYLLDNPLLKRKLVISDVKTKLVGHWGTVPGQNFIITHLNYLSSKNDLNMMLVVGPGHGGNAALANCYLEGTYSKYYPQIKEDEAGLKKLFKQFSFPGGVSSHVAPETPGSINEGGELGYSLVHSFGAALDNPNLIVACIVGDGEAETGPLATSWNLNKLLNPVKDGIVLPILHLNGYKISNPTVMGRMSKSELKSYFEGLGWKPYFVEVGEISNSHNKMAEKLNQALEDIKEIKRLSNISINLDKPNYPVIIFCSPKGWTGPEFVNGIQISNTFRAHQIPVIIEKDSGKNLDILENWLQSYNPQELFDESGKLLDIYKSILPKNKIFDNVVANGGKNLKELKLPNYKKYAVNISKNKRNTQDMTVVANYLRDVIKLNSNNNNFRIFAPDEILSNRMAPLFEATSRQFNAIIKSNDKFINTSGRVIDSFLSEHICEGLLEGYILSGRHGIFTSYEAFIRVVDSMISQHAKWLKVCSQIDWRADISSLNLLLTSHCWQQDHNGYTHQDPGLLNHLVTKKSSIVRMYLPPDANTLLSTVNHVLGTKNYINVIVASKHPSYQWLDIDEAEKYCKEGISEWKWASNLTKNDEPDLIMCSAGDTPTLEALAATKLLQEYIPSLKVKFVNVIDLMKLDSNLHHPHGLSDKKFDDLFTIDKPIILNFHGYPSLIHQLTYSRKNQNLHVHGYDEEGTITTGFDMRVQNKIDRYNLVLDALKYLPQYGSEAEVLRTYCLNMLKKHKKYINEYGADMPEVASWKWEND